MRKQSFSKKNEWIEHNLQLELVENCQLWSVTIQTEEDFIEGLCPDEVFLLQSVERMVTGLFDNSDINFIKFMFRIESNPVIVKFPEQR